jgi:hypothetical protein
LDYFISERLRYSIPPPEVAAVAGGIFLCSHAMALAGQINDTERHTRLALYRHEEFLV